eukprot:5796714-Prymnesium_polylepis.1
MDVARRASLGGVIRAVARTAGSHGRPPRHRRVDPPRQVLLEAQPVRPPLRALPSRRSDRALRRDGRVTKHGGCKARRQEMVAALRRGETRAA